MDPRPPEELSDQQLLQAIVELGGGVVRVCQEKMADAGRIHDDPRWTGSPLPLRFESQIFVLFLGALDAYDAGAALLRDRASQQAFNLIRFQVETLVLVRWMAEPSDPRERQWRAYRVLCGQIARWRKVLAQDATKGSAKSQAEAQEVVRRIDEWMDLLVKLVQEDGYPRPPKMPPGRPYLFENYLKEAGYEAFGMYSEMGSHPGAVGNILFAMEGSSADSISFSLGAAFGQRAYWAGAALMFLHLTIRDVGVALAWEDWLKQEMIPGVDRAAPYLKEAAKRKGRAAE